MRSIEVVEVVVGVDVGLGVWVVAVRLAEEMMLHFGEVELEMERGLVACGVL